MSQQLPEEQISLEVKFRSCVGKVPKQWTGCHLQANTGILSRLGLKHFLENPFQFIIH
jgi:hypothetical protein